MWSVSEEGSHLRLIDCRIIQFYARNKEEAGDVLLAGGIGGGEGGEERARLARLRPNERVLAHRQILTYRSCFRFAEGATEQAEQKPRFFLMD